MTDDLRNVLCVALGGAAGSVARYLVAGWVARGAGSALPWGTLTVNLAGSFLLGLLFAFAASSERLGPTLVLTLSTGFLGGFTTYSSFSLETWRLLEAQSAASAAAYAALTLVGCLAATGSGVALGRVAAG